MQTKLCTNCNTEKPYSEFYKNKSRHLGIACYCKKCSIKYVIKWQRNNAEKFRIRQQEWRKRNPEKEKEKTQKWQKANLAKCAERSMRWQKNNPERTREISLKAKKKSYSKKKNDIRYKLNRAMRSSMWTALKKKKNGQHWESLIGYKLNDLMKYIEKLFTEDMTWNNYGRNGWEIDHKIPISVFNFTKPEHKDFKKCWALKNLQPMWKKENILKSNKLDKHFQPSLLIV